MYICYESYESKAEKRKAQRGAVGSKPTGKATDYLLVNKADYTILDTGTVFGAIVPVYRQEPGEDCHGLCYTSVSVEYLARCRRVGRRHLPKQWQESFQRYLDN